MNQFGICMKVYNYNICISHKIVFDKRLEDTIVRYYLKGSGHKFGPGFGKYGFGKI